MQITTPLKGFLPNEGDKDFTKIPQCNKRVTATHQSDDGITTETAVTRLLHCGIL